jgi:lipopolysaccharide/colanic/teichoic acid biosynthesis glycosyltransferase
VNPESERIKRALDIVGGAAGVALAAPLLALAALAIKLEDGGPILFRQTRLGRGARHFEILKLRTMTIDADKQRSDGVVEAGDPRITRVGKLLRRTAVDELPQLWHVLRGDMSLVGPRPVPPPHLERYDERQRRRLEVRPGLTGWAQVHGRASLPWPERLELDVWYVEHQSLSLDARILARTASVLLRRDVAYRGEAGGWR